MIADEKTRLMTTTETREQAENVRGSLTFIARVRLKQLRFFLDRIGAERQTGSQVSSETLVRGHVETPFLCFFSPTLSYHPLLESYRQPSMGKLPAYEPCL